MSDDRRHGVVSAGGKPDIPVPIPLSDVERAANVHQIRQWRDLYPHFRVEDWGEDGVFEMVDLLLAEIDRRDAILRPIVLADPRVCLAASSDESQDVCFYCGWNPPDHPDDCTWLQAALLIAVAGE